MKRSVVFSFLVLFVIAVGASSAAVYYYMQYRTMERRINDPEFGVREMLAKVSTLMELPQGEEPTVATVNNPDVIKDQPFFMKAKKGDRVILYQNAGIAILYDEKVNKILNFGTINVNAGATPSAQPMTDTNPTPLDTTVQEEIPVP